MGLTSGILPFHSIEMSKVDMILILHPDFRQCSFQTKELPFPPNHHDGCVTFCVMQNRNFSTMHVRMEDARENLEIRHVGDAPRRWPARYRETYEGRKQGSYIIQRQQIQITDPSYLASSV